MNNSENITVTQETLETYWEQFIGLTNEDTKLVHSKHIFIDSFKSLVDTTKYDGNLNLKSRAFTIELKKSLFRHLATIAVTNTLLFHFEVSEIPAHILHLVIGTIFELERIEISSEHEMIYLSLPLKEDKKNYKSAAEWYSDLSDEIRNEVNEIDFNEFLEKMIFTGYALSKEDKYLILNKDKNILKIHIR